MRRRDLAALLLTLTILWNLFGFAAKFFSRAWGDTTLPANAISAVATGLLVIALFVLPRPYRWTTLATIGAALIMAVWSLLGVILWLISKKQAGLPWGLPGILGPGVPLILALLTVLVGLWLARAARPVTEPRP